MITITMKKCRLDNFAVAFTRLLEYTNLSNLEKDNLASSVEDINNFIIEGNEEHNRIVRRYGVENNGIVQVHQDKLGEELRIEYSECLELLDSKVTEISMALVSLGDNKYFSSGDYYLLSELIIV